MINIAWRTRKSRPCTGGPSCGSSVKILLKDSFKSQRGISADAYISHSAPLFPLRGAIIARVCNFMVVWDHSQGETPCLDNNEQILLLTTLSRLSSSGASSMIGFVQDVRTQLPQQMQWLCMCCSTSNLYAPQTRASKSEEGRSGQSPLCGNLSGTAPVVLYPWNNTSKFTQDPIEHSEPKPAPSE